MPFLAESQDASAAARPCDATQVRILSSVDRILDEEAWLEDILKTFLDRGRAGQRLRCRKCSGAPAGFPAPFPPRMPGFNMATCGVCVAAQPRGG